MILRKRLHFKKKGSLTSTQRSLNATLSFYALCPTLSDDVQAEECTRKLSAYEKAGAQMVFVWPITDETRQLELFKQSVASGI